MRAGDSLASDREETVGRAHQEDAELSDGKTQRIGQWSGEVVCGYVGGRLGAKSQKCLEADRGVGDDV